MNKLYLVASFILIGFLSLFCGYLIGRQKSTTITTDTETTPKPTVIITEMLTPTPKATISATPTATATPTPTIKLVIPSLKVVKPLIINTPTSTPTSTPTLNLNLRINPSLKVMP